MQLSYNLMTGLLKKAANTLLSVVFNTFQTTQSYFQRIYQSNHVLKYKSMAALFQNRKLRSLSHPQQNTQKQGWKPLAPFQCHLHKQSYTSKIHSSGTQTTHIFGQCSLCCYKRSVQSTIHTCGHDIWLDLKENSKQTPRH